MLFSKDNKVVIALRVDLILTFYVANMSFGKFKCLLGIISNNVLSVILIITLILINHSSKLFSKDMQKKRITNFYFRN